MAPLNNTPATEIPYSLLPIVSQQSHHNISPHSPSSPLHPTISPYNPPSKTSPIPQQRALPTIIGLGSNTPDTPLASCS